MKPFCLTKVLAGDPIQTRDGKPIKFVAYLPDDGMKGDFNLIGVINGVVRTWNSRTGAFDVDETDPYDIFMAPKTVTRYANVYVLTSKNNHYSPGTILFGREELYENERIAQIGCDIDPNSNKKYLKTIAVEVEL